LLNYAAQSAKPDLQPPLAGTINSQKKHALPPPQHQLAALYRLWSASVEFNEDVRMSTVILTRLARLIESCATPSATGSAISPASTRLPSVPASTSRDRSMGCCCARRSVARWPRLVRGLRVPQGLPRRLCVPHRGPSSAIYFDILKDRLYTTHEIACAAQRAATPLRLLDSLVRLLAPLMSFTREEV